jgi:broad specificity phosphatase PhoE
MLVVRHGESVWNVEGRWSGQADPPLTQAGLKAAEALAAELRGLRFDAAASSDLARARHTAEILSHELRLPSPRLNPGLRERDMGWLEGRTRGEIEEKWPGWTERWRREEAQEVPDGERRDDFDRRVITALREVAGNGADGSAAERVVVVAHAGTLRALSRLLGEPRRSWPNLTGMWVEVGPEAELAVPHAT